jgi:hypothetical protein
MQHGNASHGVARRGSTTTKSTKYEQTNYNNHMATLALRTQVPANDFARLIHAHDCIQC